MGLNSSSTRFQEKLDSVLNFDRDHPSYSRVSRLLCEPISNFASPKISVVRPDTTASEAYMTLYESNSMIALVQSDESRIDGILEFHVLRERLESGKASTTLQVADLMERNVSIEPEMASLREVIVRVTVGACRCVILVNRSGVPYSIITPEELCEVVNSSKI